MFRVPEHVQPNVKSVLTRSVLYFTNLEGWTTPSENLNSFKARAHQKRDAVKLIQIMRFCSGPGLWVHATDSLSL